MSDDNQIAIPPSFVALFVEPGRVRKPGATRAVIGERYEFCEDLATALVDRAQALLWDLKIGRDEVLLRLHRGLIEGPQALDAAQARWVLTRLAELLGWPPLDTGPWGSPAATAGGPGGSERAGNRRNTRGGR